MCFRRVTIELSLNTVSTRCNATTWYGHTVWPIGYLPKTLGWGQKCVPCGQNVSSSTVLSDSSMCFRQLNGRSANMCLTACYIWYGHMLTDRVGRKIVRWGSKCVMW